jgi:hypothetical protein
MAQSHQLLQTVELLQALAQSTTANIFVKTGQPSDKIFHMPNGSIERSSKIGHLATAVLAPARNVHITPVIDKTSLISTVKFAKANYRIGRGLSTSLCSPM